MTSESFRITSPATTIAKAGIEQLIASGGDLERLADPVGTVLTGSLPPTSVFPSHREAQSRGRAGIFKDNRLRIASVIRDYGMFDGEQAPSDSRGFHG